MVLSAFEFLRVRSYGVLRCLKVAFATGSQRGMMVGLGVPEAEKIFTALSRFTLSGLPICD